MTHLRIADLTAKGTVSDERLIAPSHGQSDVANRSHSRGGLLASHWAPRSRGGGKLNDLAAHDRTAFPIGWILGAVRRGVLCTRLALAIWLYLSAGVRPGVEAPTFPPGCFYVIIAYGQIKL